jgi:hypothetical protein
MGSRAIGVVLMMAVAGAMAFAQTDTPGFHEGMRLGPPPPPDTSKLQQQTAQGAAQIGAGQLKITFGKKFSAWTPATLAALPHATITVYNEHAKANQTFSGVPLIALLTPLGVQAKPHGKELRLYLVAEGADGYQVVYSVAEVNPDVHDGQVIVADSLNGKPLGGNGPLQLVATGEKRPARWVRNLVQIRVMTAE